MIDLGGGQNAEEEEQEEVEAGAVDKAVLEEEEKLREERRNAEAANTTEVRDSHAKLGACAQLCTSRDLFVHAEASGDPGWGWHPHPPISTVDPPLFSMLTRASAHHSSLALCANLKP